MSLGSHASLRPSDVTADDARATTDQFGRILVVAEKILPVKAIPTEIIENFAKIHGHLDWGELVQLLGGEGRVAMMKDLRGFSYVGGIVPPEWVREPIPGAWFEEGSEAG